MHIFTNIRDLENTYEEIKKLPEEEKVVMDTFLREGGILKSTGKIKLELIYPSKDIVEKELAQLLPERSKVMEKIEQWHKIKKDSEEFIQNNKISKFAKGTFWKHKMKETFDKDYKEDFKKIKIPIEYIGDESMRKLMDEFINNKEYRQNLIETIESSIVYRNKGIGEKVGKKLELQKEISKNKLDILRARKHKLDERINMYKTISRFIKN
jgi:hypothetical protein